jgi:hypothetical protein
MNLKPGELRKFKTAIRDLDDQELGIRSRRKQLFDLLAAQYGDNREVLRAARVIYYELQKEKMKKARQIGMEFTGSELEDREEEDDDFNAGQEA